MSDRRSQLNRDGIVLILMVLAGGAMFACAAWQFYLLHLRAKQPEIPLLLMSAWLGLGTVAMIAIAWWINTIRRS